MGVGKGSGRGGKREGAGGRAADGAAIAVQFMVGVDQASADLIEKHGDGNMSLGVRRLCALVLKAENAGTALSPIMSGAGVAPRARSGGAAVHEPVHGGARGAAGTAPASLPVLVLPRRVVVPDVPEPGRKWATGMQARRQREEDDKWEAACEAAREEHAAAMRVLAL